MSWEQHPAHRLRLEALLLELLACVALRGGASAAPPEWLQQVHDELWTKFRDPPSMEALAAAAGVHQSHLLRRFRRHYGVSPTALVRRWKAEHARALLATPGASLSAVAFEAGFADQSHMGRVLRSIYGTTPGRLQREASIVGPHPRVSARTPPRDPLPHD
jgi:AraC family transcriptional regulator